MKDAPDPVKLPSLPPVAPQHDESLSDLLAAFDVESLGYGDAMAGVNQLAVFALTLANLAPPSSCVIVPGGRRLSIGCNLLTSGPGVTSALRDEVLPALSRCQDNLLSQLTSLIRKDAAEEVRPTERRWYLEVEPEGNQGETALLDLFGKGSFYLPYDEWQCVLSEPPTSGLARHGNHVLYGSI